MRLWARDPALAAEISRRRVNDVYLPGVELPPSVTATGDLGEALAGSELVIVAVPSHGLRRVMVAAAPHLPAAATIVSTTKGLEEGTLLRMSELLARTPAARIPVAVLSGPSFASEVAKGLPTAVVVASADARTVALVQEEFRGPVPPAVRQRRRGRRRDRRRAEERDRDRGRCRRGHGAWATTRRRRWSRAAWPRSRGSPAALGGKRETLSGLAGLGDLVLTCTGALSRNRHVGIELARGRRLDDDRRPMKMVAEGVRTTQAALDLGLRHGVELPIAAQIADVLAGRKDARTALKDLMLRPQRAEVDAG